VPRSSSGSPTSLAACSSSSSMARCPAPPAAWNEVGVIAASPNRSRSTASAGVMASVVQLGLATMPSGWSSACWGLTSASTSGTCGCMRQALELSTTTAPRAAATGAHSREIPPPAENSARPAPSNTSGASGRTSTCSPRKGSSRPTERSEATSRTSPTGSRRSSSRRRMTSPTAPVAPTTTAVGAGIISAPPAARRCRPGGRGGTRPPPTGGSGRGRRGRPRRRRWRGSRRRCGSSRWRSSRC